MSTDRQSVMLDHCTNSPKLLKQICLIFISRTLLQRLDSNQQHNIQSVTAYQLTNSAAKFSFISSVVETGLEPVATTSKDVRLPINELHIGTHSVTFSPSFKFGRCSRIRTDVTGFGDQSPGPLDDTPKFQVP